MLSFYIGAINLTTSHRFIVKMRLKKRSANRLDIVGIQALTPVKLRALYNKKIKGYTTELSKEKNNLIAIKKRNLLLRKRLPDQNQNKEVSNECR